MTISNTPEGSACLRNIHFIMVRPSHPGNVGAAARAIKTMGLSRLSLVAPRLDDIASRAEAQALASGAADILENLHIVASLEAALASSTLAFALTARPRDLGPPVCDIRTAAREARQHLANHGHAEVALVFGTERSGLDNQDLALCQRLCHIPANPAYSSLNVAQAIQLAAWEMRYACLIEHQNTPLPTTSRQSDPPGNHPASNEKNQALLAHWEQALSSIGFLDPDHPKKLMLRMRHLLMRCQLSNDENAMLRGVCTAMIQSSEKDKTTHKQP